MREKILYEIIRRTVPFLPLLHRSHPVLYNPSIGDPSGHKLCTRSIDTGFRIHGLAGDA